MNRRRLLLLALALALSACASQREALSRIGQPPPLSPVEDPRALYGRQPVLMPMPAADPSPEADPRQTGSLWQAGANSFFRDPRARRVGDILTVEIQISDQAKVSNSTSRSRATAEDADLTALLGLEQAVGRLLPGEYDPAAAASLGSTSSLNGKGAVDRSESVRLTVAAVVTEVLPNGNLVIAGRQEVRVNSELRELLVTGVARPEDVAADNTIQHTQIAEARISYGGRGVLSDVQKPRWGQEAYEILFPF